eukprot:TRINITY_DN20778_c0_g1_i1.p1 TRINITY_DN20778_c0_g1~~TRINITY_DN20778_c0_g1_i1.p1  ORF type:complete len:119 (-),score=12.57 TRINITY_DN20778_c0_g1_i1:99-455(-)
MAEFIESMKADKNKQNDDHKMNANAPSSSNNNLKGDLSKLNGAMFTNKQEIEKFIIENQKYQALAAKDKNVICSIGKDCLKISGDIESITIDQEWNMKRRANYLVNNMCGPQIVLKVW